MITGFVLAVVLAVLAVARVSFVGGTVHFTYRQSQIWGAQETLLITQHGFTEGRTIFPSVQTKNGAFAKYADPTRLASLADFYARLANSDAVRTSVPLLHRVPPGAVTAAPVVSTIGNSAPLPMLTISGVSVLPSQAVLLAHLASSAFRAYLEQEQRDAGIPQEQRILVNVLNNANRAVVVQPRKKTIPIMVFLAVIGATFGLTLILENVRPRASVVEQLPRRDLVEHRQPQPQSTGRVGSADAHG